MIFGSWKRRHFTRITVLLTIAALVLCMSGCFTPFRSYYKLTISSSPGGNVTHPGEGTFTYWEGTVVNLVAEADTGYGFSNWTGDVDTVADVYCASTNITMDAARNLTANFTLLSHNLTTDSAAHRAQTGRPR